MKRIAIILGACALSFAGCVEPHMMGLKEKEPQGAAKTVAAERPPAVTADKVNETNARAMAAALKVEIDFDARPEEAKSTAH